MQKDGERLFFKDKGIFSTDGIRNLVENNHTLPQKHHVAENDLTLEEQLLYCKTHNEKY